MFNLILGFSLALPMAQSAMDKGDFHLTDALIQNVKPNRGNWNQYQYIKACSAFSQNKRKEAVDSIRMLNDSFSAVPARYAALSCIMEESLKTWEAGDLGDISRKMGFVKDRLNVSRGDKVTKDKQDEILRDLDELIKEKEDDMKAAAEAAASGAGKGKLGSNPLPDSIPGGGQFGEGKVDDKKLKNLAENWGRMPEKERAKAMVEITRDLPPRYRVLIEEYFKALAKSNK